MTTLPPAAYANKNMLRAAIRDNAELYREIQRDYAHQVIDIISEDMNAAELADELRAWQDKVVNNYADYLWLTQGHNYRASASELRDAYKQNEAMDARRAA